MPTGCNNGYLDSESNPYRNGTSRSRIKSRNSLYVFLRKVTVMMTRCRRFFPMLDAEVLAALSTVQDLGEDRAAKKD